MNLWIVLALFSPLLAAFSNVVDKFLLGRRVGDFLALAPVAAIIAFFFGILALLLGPHKEISIFNFLVSFILGLMSCCLFLLYYYVVSFEEISRVMSIWYVTPVLVMVLSAIFLGEILEPWRYPAIAMVATGAIMMGVQRVESKLIFRKAFYWLLLNCVLAAFSLIMQKYLLRDVSFWYLFGFQALGLSCGLFCSWFSPRVRAHVVSAFRNAQYVFLSQLFAFGSALVGLAAMSLVEVTKVSALAAVQPLYLLFIAIVLSKWLPEVLKEDISRRTLFVKCIAVFLIVVGAYGVAY